MLSILVIYAVRTILTGPVTMPATIPAGVITWQVFAFIAAGLLLVGFVIRAFNTRIFFELLIGITLFLGVWVYAWSILPWEIALVVASILTVFQARVRRTFVHNGFVLLGAAGIAIHVAFLFHLEKLAMILFAFLLFDLFAGRPKGIATQLATLFVHRGVIPGLIIPSSWKGLRQQIRDTIKDPGAIFLGAGDLILPLILVAHASVAGIWQGVAVTVGLLLGAVWLAYSGAVKPRPALVPLLLGTGIPYIIQFLLHVV
ncbi:hypothetical protein GF380_03505 [Candidatus Uhrbacteria bacterium]|nr:hypothetical protein [Candidatus Uhrbacteria bacterium]MBD3284192.1 hypothetical protein [Candidatus Uhrbacteria bacterium]